MTKSERWRDSLEAVHRASNIDLYSWLNAQLAEAVKFSSHKDQSTLQDQHFA